MGHTFFVDMLDVFDAEMISETGANVLAIRVGEQGYYPVFTGRKAAELNDDGVTKEILESAVIGSMFGWRCPGAALAVAYVAMRG